MYTRVIKILKADTFHGRGFRTEVAKGHYAIPRTFKDFFVQLKRILHGKRYKF
jgi:hypothetical protein